MKKNQILFLAISITLILSSCTSSLKVVSDYNGDLDFSKFKTYNFKKSDTVSIDAKYPTIINPLNQRRVESAIDEEMYLRGYSKSENPDIWISYYVKMEDKTEYGATNYGYNTPYYMGPRYYGYYPGYLHTYTEVTSYDYKVGTLVIDLVDAKSNELMWYGAGSKALAENPRHIEEVINDAVTKIFYEYCFLAGQKEPVKTSLPRSK